MPERDQLVTDLYSNNPSRTESLERASLRGDSTALQALGCEWNELFAALPEPEPFTRFDWFVAYALAFERQSTLHIVTVRDETTLRGALPLVEQPTCFGVIPARTLRSLSGKHSCRFDLLASASNESDIVKCIWQTLRANPWWDAIEVLDVPEDSTFCRVAALASAEDFPVAVWPTLLSPYLQIATDGTDPFAHCPPKHRRTRRRIENAFAKLNTKGTISVEVSTQGDTATLERFLALEAAGWKGKNKSAIQCSPRTVEFYRQIYERFSKTGSLLLYTLRSGAHVVAMEFGIIESQRYFSPKVAYDEQFSSYSPGHILTKLIIEDLATRGISRYDFLGARGRHKTIWTEHVRSHRHMLIFRPTIAGRMRFRFITQVAMNLRRLRRSFWPDPQGSACPGSEPNRAQKGATEVP